MVQTTSTPLLESTIHFLREYCHLGDGREVEFTRPVHDPGFLSPTALKGPWYMNDPIHYRPPETYNEVERAYEGMQSCLPRMNSQRNGHLYKMIEDYVEDSEEFVLVDIGSFLGRSHPRPLAKRKKNVRVFMVDRVRIADIDESNFMSFEGPYVYGEGFEVRVPYRGNDESWMNELLRANGYHNVRYLHRELTQSLSGSELEEIEEFTRSRRVIFTGLSNPIFLSYATIREADNHDAERVCITPTALEKIDRHGLSWGTFYQFLFDHLDAEEIERYYRLLHDEFWETRTDEKYDYKKPGEKRIAVGLKQMFILHLFDLLARRGYETDLFLDEDDRSSGNYNKYDHILVSSRQVQR